MRRMLRNITIILVVSCLLACIDNNANRTTAFTTINNPILEKPCVIIDSLGEWSEIIFDRSGMIEKMAYAETANFIHERIYPCARCFLRPEAADALLGANKLAMKEGLRLVIYDCYRPKMYQQKMFDLVKNPDYVAKPGKGSMHNKGLAVDLGLADNKGTLLDFGSAFDEFSEKSHYLCNGISIEAKSNRKKLREMMVMAGFEPYKNEWWHFSYTKKSYEADDFIWDCNK